MNENRLPDDLEHMQQPATDACGFVDGMDKAAFLIDKRTQQAVIMSVIIIGEPTGIYSMLKNSWPPLRKNE